METPLKYFLYLLLLLTVGFVHKQSEVFDRKLPVLISRVISRENRLYTGYNSPCSTKRKKQAHKSPFYRHLRAFENYSNSFTLILHTVILYIFYTFICVSFDTLFILSVSFKNWCTQIVPRRTNYGCLSCNRI